MGRNRTRADNRNHGGRTAPRGKRDAAKVSKLAELARKLERTQQLPVGLMPLEVNQYKATGTLPSETKRAAQIIRGGPRREAVDRRVGPIERIQRAIEMVKKSMGVLAKLGFTEARPYLEAGIQACDQHEVVATDFMEWPELTEAVMDHTFDKKRGFKFDGEKRLHFQVSCAQLENTNADSKYFPRPEGGEYKHDDSHHLFKKNTSVKSASFYGSPNFPHDFTSRSTMFPLDTIPLRAASHDHNTIRDFLSDFFNAQTHNPHTPQKHDLKTEENATICNAILSIATVNDQMKYYDKPTSESVYTRDYEIIFNEVVGEMVFDHSTMVLKVEVHRKMATAVPTAVCSEPGSKVIPLFEEAIIYVQRVENTEYKYTKSCLVFASVPVVAGHLAHMHVIGDNAFTLKLGNSFKNSGDRHQKSMTNVGIAVGLLDKVERLSQLDPEQRKKIETAFKFLIDEHHSRPKAHLEKVIADKKKAALSAATNEAARQAILKNQKSDTSTEASRLLSNSFLSNQLKKAAITTADSARMPQVRHWIASATFSFVTIQIEGTSRSYCFIQSFSPTNRVSHTDSPQVNVDPITEPREMKRRNRWVDPVPKSSRKVVNYETQEAGETLKEMRKVRVFPSPTEVNENGSIHRSASFGGTKVVRPPPNRHNSFNETKPSRMQAKYTSSLPPELELELELL
jgi:hypothetical protein